MVVGGNSSNKLWLLVRFLRVSIQLLAPSSRMEMRSITEQFDKRLVRWRDLPVSCQHNPPSPPPALTLPPLASASTSAMYIIRPVASTNTKTSVTAGRGAANLANSRLPAAAATTRPPALTLAICCYAETI